MKDDYANSSHYLTYKFLLKRLRRMYFMNLGVKGLKHFTTLLGAKAFNLFSPKFKKYILPNFSREMYKWGSENWYKNHLSIWVSYEKPSSSYCVM